MSKPNQKPLSRREFLKLSGATSLGLILSACGLAEMPTAITALTNTPLLTVTSTRTPTSSPTIPSTSTNTPTPKSPETLREYADALGISIGTLMDGTAEFWQNPKWVEVASREFNLGVITPLWHGVFEKQGSENFEYADVQLKFAKRGKMDVHVESLVMTGFNPKWVTEGNFTKEELTGLFEKFCRTVIRRYKGKVKSWSAVIEAGMVYGRGVDFWYDHLGDEYIDFACQIIREEDPGSEVLYGDFGNFTRNGIKYQQTRKIVDRLVPKGLLDGVGIEIKIEKLPDKQELIETMRSYGIPVYITELDVDLRNMGGTDEERFNKQAEIYKTVVEAALESGMCRQITFWGIGDKYSWLEQPQFNGSKNADPTIFDDNLEPKPAYYAVRDVLAQHLTRTP